jgi:foldase protein PrsA
MHVLDSIAKRKFIIIAVTAVVIVGSIAGVAIYRDRVAPFNTVVVEVDGTLINMRYFVKRVAMYGGDAMGMLQLLSREEILKTTATKPPYNISVTEQDIDKYARNLAGGGTQAIDEAEYGEWFRQQLNETRLSESEYRDLLRTSLLSRRMSELLGEQLPTASEQVFIHMIPVADQRTATEVKEKHDAGADFAALAREYSLDANLGEKGGGVGWFARGVLDYRFDAAAFNLRVGESSAPIPFDEEKFAIIMISEKVAIREMDEQSLTVTRAAALEQWHNEESENHIVQFHGFTNGYDSQTDAWVQWQVARMKRGK